MKIETSLLKPVVQSAAKLAAKRTTLPVLNHLLLDGSNGCLNVSATDIDVFTSASVEKKSGQLPRLCVSAKAFAILVDSAGETVELEVLKSNGRLRMTSGWTRDFPTLPAEEFIPQPDVKGMKALSVPAEDLAEAIESVAWAADPAPSDMRRFKESILIELKPKQLRAVATDTQQFGMFTRRPICSDVSFQLPVKAADLFCAALRGENSKLLHSDKRIIVTHDAGFFSVALPEEKWPDYKAIINSERVSLGSCTVGPLRGCLERASTVYAEPFAPVTLSIEDGTWTISAEGANGSYNEEFEPAKKNTAKHSLRVNATNFLNALRQFGAEDTPALSVTPDSVPRGGLFMEQGDLLFCVNKLVDQKPK